MAWRRLLTQGSIQQSELWRFKDLYAQSHLPFHKFLSGEGNRILGMQERFQSNNVGNLPRRAGDADGVNDATLLKELYRCSDPEVIRLFVLKVDNVDMIIARGTPGFSGAYLAKLLNNAALKAALDSAKAVSMADLEYAKGKIMMGSKHISSVISDES